jgi:DNA-binding NarL/FixJ family response regulator
MERELTILLLEDEPNVCHDIIQYVETQNDVILIDVTNNASKAEQIIRNRLPDAVILDLELHGGKGSGISLLQALQQDPPARMPYILVATNNSSTTTYEAARQFGADYILSKHQEDYCAKTPVDFLRMLKNVIQRKHAEPMQAVPGEGSAELRNKQIVRWIHRELDKIGIPPKAVGYPYFVDAIQIVAQAPKPNLCSVIGQKYGKTEASVERAMQNAIAKAWRTTPIEDLLSYYTARIHSEKGTPTVTEFVYYYANKIKTED